MNTNNVNLRIFLKHEDFHKISMKYWLNPGSEEQMSTIQDLSPCIAKSLHSRNSWNGKRVDSIFGTAFMSTIFFIVWSQNWSLCELLYPWSYSRLFQVVSPIAFKTIESTMEIYFRLHSLSIFLITPRIKSQFSVSLSLPPAQYLLFCPFLEGNWT